MGEAASRTGITPVIPVRSALVGRATRGAGAGQYGKVGGGLHHSDTVDQRIGAAARSIAVLAGLLETALQFRDPLLSGGPFPLQFRDSLLGDGALRRFLLQRRVLVGQRRRLFGDLPLHLAPRLRYLVLQRHRARFAGAAQQEIEEWKDGRNRLANKPTQAMLSQRNTDRRLGALTT